MLVRFSVFALILLFLSAGLGIWGIGSYCYHIARYTQEQMHSMQLTQTIDSFENLANQYQNQVEILFNTETTERLSSGLSLVNDDIRKLGVGGRPSLASQAQQMLASPLIKRAATIEASFVTKQRQWNFVNDLLHDVEKHKQRQQSYFDERPSTWPVKGRVTSDFGLRTHPILGEELFHNGIDIANAEWVPIQATADGICTYSGDRGTYGITVDLTHRSTNCLTRYAHLADVAVRKGEWIKRGDIIGYLGNTGRSTGPHLHYEVHQNGRVQTPWNYFLDSNVIID